MFGRTSPEKRVAPQPAANDSSPVQFMLLTIMGERAKLEGRFEVADSIRVECEIGGELNVGGRLVIGEKGVVRADVKTVDAVVQGRYEGNMVATGNVEITATGRVIGNVETDSLVIAKGGFFNGDVVRFKEWAGEGDEEGEARQVTGSAQGGVEERTIRRPFWPRKVSDNARAARPPEGADQWARSSQEAQGPQAELELSDGKEGEGVERPDAVELQSALRTDSALRVPDPGEGERGVDEVRGQEEPNES